MEGVWVAGAAGEAARFVRTRGPTEPELVAMSSRIEASVTRWLKRKGLLRCAGAESEAGEEEAAPTGIEVCVQTTLSLGEVGAVDELAWTSPAAVSATRSMPVSRLSRSCFDAHAA